MSGVSVNYAGNGMFSVTVNGKTESLNMADLNAMLRMEQVEGMDQTIADQLGEIRKTNQKRKTLNQFLARLRDFKHRKIDDNASGERFTLEGTDGTSRQVHEWETYFGIDAPDAKGGGDGGAYDAKISAVKSQIDNITSDSEMQMLRFRQMVDKRGTALQEAKTTLSNDKRLKDAIVQG